MKLPLFDFNKEFVKAKNAYSAMTPERLIHELDHQKKLSYDQGYKDGICEVGDPLSNTFPESWKSEIVNNCRQMNESIPHLLENQNQLLDNVKDQLIQICCSMVKCILPHQLEKHGHDEIVQAIESLLPKVPHDTKAEIQVNSRSFPIIKDLCAAFENIEVVTDDSLGQGEFNMNAAQGGVRRYLSDIWEKIEEELMVSQNSQEVGGKNND